MSITITTPSSTRQLTTLANLKAVAGITAITDDTLLGLIIDRQSAAIETFCNRIFAKQTYTETIAGNGTNKLRIAQYPLVSVTSITNDEITVASTDYTTQDRESGYIYSNYGWYNTLGEKLYSVVYVSGYILPGMAGTRDLPYDIEDACIKACYASYVSRKINPLIKSESVPEVYSVDYGTNGMNSGLPLIVKDMLIPYRKFNI